MKKALDKKKLAILAAIAMSVTAMPAFAQSNGGPMQGGQGQGQQGPSQQERQQRFEARKADILSHMQKNMACVQAATDPESMRACMPNRGGRMGGGGDQGGGGDNAPSPPQGSDE